MMSQNELIKNTQHIIEQILLLKRLIVSSSFEGMTVEESERMLKRSDDILRLFDQIIVLNGKLEGLILEQNAELDLVIAKFSKLKDSELKN